MVLVKQVMSQITLGVVGIGHFGTALIKGIFNTTNHIDIVITKRGGENFIDPQLKVVEDIEDMKEISDAIVLCIRPQDMNEVIEEFSDYEGLLITFAAGLPLRYYESKAPQISIIRAMSNIAIEYKEGLIAWVKNNNCKLEDDILFHNIFTQVAHLLEYEREHESALDTITAISGSGIAYLAQIFNTIKEVGMQQGLSDGDSELIIEKTVRGVLALKENTGLKLEEIVNKVASKGGTTEVGIASMKHMGMEKALSTGLKDTIVKCRKFRP